MTFDRSIRNIKKINDRHAKVVFFALLLHMVMTKMMRRSRRYMRMRIQMCLTSCLLITKTRMIGIVEMMRRVKAIKRVRLFVSFMRLRIESVYQSPTSNPFSIFTTTLNRVGRS